MTLKAEPEDETLLNSTGNGCFLVRYSDFHWGSS